MSAASSAFHKLPKDYHFCLYNSPPSANMADDQGEARAVQLASKALELIASGEDEVRKDRYLHCYSR